MKGLAGEYIEFAEVGRATAFSVYSAVKHPPNCIAFVGDLLFWKSC